VQVLRQLPVMRARMVRDIVANDAATGFDSRRPLQFAPADGPVDGLLSRRCWFESDSGRQSVPRRWSGAAFPKRSRARSTRAEGAAAVPQQAEGPALKAGQYRFDPCVPHHIARLAEEADAAASNTAAFESVRVRFSRRAPITSRWWN
jgi:hypothetical protein